MRFHLKSWRRAGKAGASGEPGGKPAVPGKGNRVAACVTALFLGGGLAMAGGVAHAQDSLPVSAAAFAKLRAGDMKFAGFSAAADAIPGVKPAHDWAAMAAGWKAALPRSGSG